MWTGAGPSVAVILAVAVATSGIADAAGASLRLSCRGEEPFWGLEADDLAGRFSEPGAERALPGRLDALDWLPPGWLVGAARTRDSR